MQIWEHAQAMIPFDVLQVNDHLTKMEPDGWQLVAMTQIAIGGKAHLDGSGRLVEGQPQPAFLLVFKRPKADVVAEVSALKTVV